MAIIAQEALLKCNELCHSVSTLQKDNIQMQRKLLEYVRQPQFDLQLDLLRSQVDDQAHTRTSEVQMLKTHCVSKTKEVDARLEQELITIKDFF